MNRVLTFISRPYIKSLVSPHQMKSQTLSSSSCDSLHFDKNYGGNLVGSCTHSPVSPLLINLKLVIIQLIVSSLKGIGLLKL